MSEDCGSEKDAGLESRAVIADCKDKSERNNVGDLVAAQRAVSNALAGIDLRPLPPGSVGDVPGRTTVMTAPFTINKHRALPRMPSGSGNLISNQSTLTSQPQQPRPQEAGIMQRPELSATERLGARLMMPTPHAGSTASPTVMYGGGHPSPQSGNVNSLVAGGSDHAYMQTYIPGQLQAQAMTSQLPMSASEYTTQLLLMHHQQMQAHLGQQMLQQMPDPLLAVDPVPGEAVNMQPAPSFVRVRAMSSSPAAQGVQIQNSAAAVPMGPSNPMFSGARPEMLSGGTLSTPSGGLSAMGSPGLSAGIPGAYTALSRLGSTNQPLARLPGAPLDFSQERSRIAVRIMGGHTQAGQGLHAHRDMFAAATGGPQAHHPLRPVSDDTATRIIRPKPRPISDDVSYRSDMHGVFLDSVHSTAFQGDMELLDNYDRGAVALMLQAQQGGYLALKQQLSGEFSILLALTDLLIRVASNLTQPRDAVGDLNRLLLSVRKHAADHPPVSPPMRLAVQVVVRVLSGLCPAGMADRADLWAACFRLLRVVATNCGELNAFLINLNEQRGNKERNNGHTAGAAALPAPGPLLVVLNHLSSLAHRNQAVMAGQQQLPQGQGQGVQTATNTQAAMIKEQREQERADGIVRSTSVPTHPHVPLMQHTHLAQQRQPFKFASNLSNCQQQAGWDRESGEPMSDPSGTSQSVLSRMQSDSAARLSGPADLFRQADLFNTALWPTADAQGNTLDTADLVTSLFRTEPHGKANGTGIAEKPQWDLSGRLQGSGTHTSQSSASMLSALGQVNATQAAADLTPALAHGSYGLMHDSHASHIDIESLGDLLQEASALLLQSQQQQEHQGGRGDTSGTIFDFVSEATRGTIAPLGADSMDFTPHGANRASAMPPALSGGHLHRTPSDGVGLLSGGRLLAGLLTPPGSAGAGLGPDSPGSAASVPPSGVVSRAPVSHMHASASDLGTGSRQLNASLSSHMLLSPGCQQLGSPKAMDGGGMGMASADTLAAQLRSIHLTHIMNPQHQRRVNSE